MSPHPAVLLLSGLDPSGGAGIAADIETLSFHHVSALPIVTTLTAQNTQSLSSQMPVSTALMSEQIKLIAADIDYQAIKIGLLATIAQIKWLGRLLTTQTVPIVLDPILKASAGGVFLDEPKRLALIKYLLAKVTLLTPNRAELQQLTGVNDRDQAALKLPCEWLLVTDGEGKDGHEIGAHIEHRLYHQGRYIQSFYDKRLARRYHGSGCTLASAAAANLALGFDVETACQRALEYTHKTLVNAIKLGKAQYHPKRYLR